MTFYDLFLQSQGCHGPLAPPLDPLLLVQSCSLLDPPHRLLPSTAKFVTFLSVQSRPVTHLHVKSECHHHTMQTLTRT